VIKSAPSQPLQLAAINKEQTMKRIIPLALSLSLVALALPINDGTSYAQRGRPVTGQQSRPSPLSLDQQAQQQVDSFWSARVTRCGDSHYTRFRGSGALAEFRGWTVRIEPQRLTEVDRLNGLRYSAIIRFSAVAKREFSIQEGRWTSWSGLVSMLNTNRITNHRGQWSIDENSRWNSSASMQAISCQVALNPVAYASNIRRETANARDVEMIRTAPSVGLYVSDVPTIPMDIFRSLYSLERNFRLKRVAFAPDGGVAYTIGEGEANGHNPLPSSLVSKIREIRFGIREIAFIPPRGWIMFYDRDGGNTTYWVGEGIPQTFQDYLRQNSRSTSEGPALPNGTGLVSVSFGPDEMWVIILRERSTRDRRWWQCWCSQEVQEAMKTAEQQSPNGLYQFHYTANGGFVILHGRNGFITHNAPTSLVETLSRLQQEGHDIQWVATTPEGGWVIRRAH
jgi:hypothetical protein